MSNTNKHENISRRLKVTESDVLEYCRINNIPVDNGLIDPRYLDQVKQFIYNKNRSKVVKENKPVNFNDYLKDLQ